MKGKSQSEGPWMLPDGWRWDTLQAVAPVNPKRDFAGVAPDDEISFVPMAAVTEETGAIDVSQRRPASAVRNGYTKFRSHDVLFAKITPCMENGKVAVVPKLTPGVGAGSTEFHVLEPKGVDPTYLYYWLSQRSFRENAEFNMTGTAGQKRVPVEYMRSALMPVPTPETQHRIVVQIDELFAELDDGEVALARARSELEIYRKALLKAAVTGELTADWRAANPPKETGDGLLQRILVERRKRWDAEPRNKGKRYTPPLPPSARQPASLPDSWEWASVGQLSIIESGGTPKGIESIAKPSGEIPWFKVSSMSEPGNERFMTASKWWLTRDQAVKANLRIMPAGSVVFPKLGGALMTNKRRRLAQDSAFDLNNMAVAAIPPVEEYLWRYFEGLDLAALSDGSIVPQLKAGTVASLGIGLPPEQELAEVIRVISALTDDTENSFKIWSEGASAAKTLRQSILAAAFRGELVA